MNMWIFVAFCPDVPFDAAFAEILTSNLVGILPQIGLSLYLIYLFRSPRHETQILPVEIQNHALLVLDESQNSVVADINWDLFLQSDHISSFFMGPLVIRTHWQLV